MDGNAKKIKSIKNAEKRRERSKVAARCRRGKESDIFNDLSASLPITDASKSALDKASVMRLTLCNLKLKKMMNTVGGLWNKGITGLLNSDFETEMNQGLGGFIIVCGLDGDVIYASEGITPQLGISQYEIMGQSIFDFSHQYDHNDIKGMLLSNKKGEQEDANGKRSALFRMKCTVSSRGRNAHLRSANYKVVNCIGRIIEGPVGSTPLENNNDNKWFISICEPLLHPSDVDIPLNKQTFLSKHTPDMKFDYVDDTVGELLGYKPEEMVGRSLFEFSHAGDGVGIMKAFKSLYDKEQNQTEPYRFLTKGGGWIWIMTQATVISGQGSTKGPNSVVCIHFITSGREAEDQILSEVQMQIGEEVNVAPVIPKYVTNNNALNERKMDGIVEKQPILMSADEENNFIADLLVGPLLNQATCSTLKIFAPKTKDMETGFLMHVDDTLIPSKEEPDDLTHLAPIAGDECVPLDVPLLEDLLASLDSEDISYSFLDDEMEVQKYDKPIPPRVKVTPPTPVVINLDRIMLSHQDPLLLNTTSIVPDLSVSPPPASFRVSDGDMTYAMSASPVSSDIGLAVPMTAIQANMATRTAVAPLREKPAAHFEQRIPIQPPKQGCTPDTRVNSLVMLKKEMVFDPIPKKVQRLDDDEPAQVYILVPVSQARRGSFSTSSSVSAGDAVNEENNGRFDLVDLVRAQQFQLQQQAMINKELLASMGNISGVSKHERKRDFSGSLLCDRPLSLHELTRQDCEVNAPLSRNIDLLQGPDLLQALEIEGIPEV